MLGQHGGPFQGRGIQDAGADHDAVRLHLHRGHENNAMRNLYLSRAVLASFDGEAGAGAGDAGAAAGAGAGTGGAGAGAGTVAGAGAAAGAGDSRFTQEDVNRMLADDRRKHQAQVQRVEKMLEEMSASQEPDHPRARAIGPAVGRPAEGDADEGTAAGSREEATRRAVHEAVDGREEGPRGVGESLP